MSDPKSNVESETVKVVVRCRPMNSREKTDGRKSVVDCNVPLSMITINNPDSGAISSDPKSFSFDAVYDEDSTQRAVYDETAYPLVESVLAGYNGTIFAYGQTGCGKTHTMQGRADPPELRGVIPNSFDHIFDHIKLATATEFLVRCSYLEIYNEEIRDLLSSDHTAKLELHEDPDRGVFVKDLTQVVVDSGQAIDKVMNDGNKHRTTGATLMNDTSSRSHSIFTVIIEMSAMKSADGKEHITRGKLNLVDLAGSERPAKTGATGTRMKEGIKINLSLTALGNVISALVEGASKARHIPYRDSKLTRLLQDSLGGNTKTVMVAAIGPADYNYDETLSTLRYANRAKNIKNKPVINEDPKDTLLRQYKEEIERLRMLLVQHLTAAGLDPETLNNILAATTGAMGGGGGGGNSALKPLPAAPAGSKPSPTVTQLAAAAAAAASSSSSSAPSPVATSNSSNGSASEGGINRPASRSVSTPRETIRVGAGGESQEVVGDDQQSTPQRDDASSSSAVDNNSEGNMIPMSPSLKSSSDSEREDGNGGRSGSYPMSGGRGRSFRTPSGAMVLGAEAQEAIEAARRDADRERREREELARKLLALQQMVVGAPGANGGGGGSQTSSSSGGGGGARRQSNSSNGGSNSTGGGGGDLQQARAREAGRAAQLTSIRQSKSRAAAAALAARSAAAGTADDIDDGGEDDDDMMDGPRRSSSGPRSQSIGASGAPSNLPRCSTCNGSGLAPTSSSTNIPTALTTPGLDPSVSSAPLTTGGPSTASSVSAVDLPTSPTASSSSSSSSSLPSTSIPLVDQQQQQQQLSAPQFSGAPVLSTEDRALLTKPERERLLRKARVKYGAKADSLRREILDLQDEYAQQRESLMSTVREQNKESKLLEALVSLFLSPLEVSKVWERAVWSEETEEWTIPRVKPRPGMTVRAKMANSMRQPQQQQQQQIGYANGGYNSLPFRQKFNGKGFGGGGGGGLIPSGASSDAEDVGDGAGSLTYATSDPSVVGDGSSVIDQPQFEIQHEEGDDEDEEGGVVISDGEVESSKKKTSLPLMRNMGGSGGGGGGSSNNSVSSTPSRSSSTLRGGGGGSDLPSIGGPGGGGNSGNMTMLQQKRGTFGGGFDELPSVNGGNIRGGKGLTSSSSMSGKPPRNDENSSGFPELGGGGYSMLPLLGGSSGGGGYNNSGSSSGGGGSSLSSLPLLGGSGGSSLLGGLPGINGGSGNNRGMITLAGNVQLNLPGALSSQLAALRGLEGSMLNGGLPTIGRGGSSSLPRI